MEKLNDTMTICTLAKPDVVTISLKEYKNLLVVADQYKRLLEANERAISLDSNGKADIDYAGRNLILFALKILEPETLNYRVKQLKKEAGYDSMD